MKRYPSCLAIRLQAASQLVSKPAATKTILEAQP